jgi:2-polyprenyl-3-methyl-5-hydroxy-6-metoxy-1,4-benzoquinol methylase
MPFQIIEGTTHQRDDFGLRPEALRLLWKMEERHFWHRARNKWIQRALSEGGAGPDSAVLEVGCGSGAVATFLHRLGYSVTGIDTFEPSVRKAHERCQHARFIVGNVSTASLGQVFDVICFFDVLEHLDRPEDLLRACFRHARAGTLFLATVPSQKALHTVIDDLSGHKRRFESGDLAALFAAAGLVNVDERAIFRLTAVFQKSARKVASGRTLSELSDAEIDLLWAANFKVPPPLVNYTLAFLCEAELRVGFDAARRRKGASLIAWGWYPGVQQ